MEKRINREIFGYVVQICFIIVFIVASYFIFTNSRISQYASTAAAYDTMNLDLMVSYSQDTDAILNTADILEKGTLSVKNPNKRGVNSVVYLYVSEDANLKTVDFIINGNKINTNNAEIKDGYYTFKILECEMGAFQNNYIDTEIKGDAFYTTPFTYMFDAESI